jgi:hypothetical protein
MTPTKTDMVLQLGLGMGLMTPLVKNRQSQDLKDMRSSPPQGRSQWKNVDLRRIKRNTAHTVFQAAFGIGAQRNEDFITFQET